MTKREAKARKEAWTKALAEGRVVKSNDGMTFKSYNTAEDAQKAVALCKFLGIEAEIVNASL